MLVPLDSLLRQVTREKLCLEDKDHRGSAVVASADNVAWPKQSAELSPNTAEPTTRSEMEERKGRNRFYINDIEDECWLIFHII